eukprot:6508462-Prymnesium_polylepis.1
MRGTHGSAAIVRSTHAHAARGERVQRSPAFSVQRDESKPPHRASGRPHRPARAQSAALLTCALTAVTSRRLAAGSSSCEQPGGGRGCEQHRVTGARTQRGNTPRPRSVPPHTSRTPNRPFPPPHRQPPPSRGAQAAPGRRRILVLGLVVPAGLAVAVAVLLVQVVVVVVVGVDPAAV